MSSLPIRPALLVVLLLATVACAPVSPETTRLSTRSETGCRFTPDTCAVLPRVRASAW